MTTDKDTVRLTKRELANLRDQFAGQALASGLIEIQAKLGWKFEAEAAYKIADAMLAARENGSPDAR